MKSFDEAKRETVMNSRSMAIEKVKLEIKRLEEKLRDLNPMDAQRAEDLFYPFYDDRTFEGRLSCRSGVSRYDAEDVAQQISNATGQTVEFVHNERIFVMKPAL